MEPKYITFEQAKFFSGKEMNIECTHGYYNHGEIELLWLDSEPENTELAKAPEQHQVIDWLLEKHGIFVEVFADDTKENHNDWTYFYNITMTRKKGESRIWIDGSAKDSPKEAYNAAFDYIRLNNLI